MKKALIILVLSFLGSTISIFSQEDVYPKGWFKTGNNPNGYRIGLDNQFFHSGQKSAFIQSFDEKDPSGFCALWQSFYADSFKNNRVKLIGFVKSEGVVSSVFLCVRIDDFDKKMVLDFDNMETRMISGTSDWMPYEIVFDVPGSRCTINFGVGLVGSGKAWIDDLNFEIVDNSTGKTAHPLNETLPDSFLINPLIPAAPINLGFEEERLTQEQ